MDAFIVQKIEKMNEIIKKVEKELKEEEMSCVRREYLEDFQYDTQKRIKELKSKFLIFTSPKDMLLHIKTTDIYNRNTGEYICLYNEEGDICSYALDNEEAKALYVKSRCNGEYWSALLGAGGHVYNLYDGSALEFCKERYKKTGWINVNP